VSEHDGVVAGSPPPWVIRATGGDRPPSLGGTSTRAAPAAPADSQSRAPAARANPQDAGAVKNTGGASPGAAGDGASDASAPATGADEASGAASSAPEAHGFDLRAHAGLAQNDSERAALDGFASVMAESGAVQGTVDRVLTWYSQALAGKETWHGFARALDNHPERISDVVRWYARREIPDDGRATREEREAARSYYARLPEAMRQALYVTGPKGEPAPGNDSRVIRMLAGWAREMKGASDAPAPSGSIADWYNGIAEREIAEATGAAKRGPDPAAERELTEIRRWMGAPRGTRDHAKYWSSPQVQSRYRELVGRQRR